MQLMMKEKGMDYNDLDLDDEDPLPKKFKFPNIKKYSSTEDPYLHLKWYVTYMKATGLNKPQIMKQFPMSLDGAPIRWYYSLESYVQTDWKELCGYLYG